MILRTFSGVAATEFVNAVVADNDASPYRPRPVGAGGDWQTDTWRDDLLQALADRHVVLGIGLRTARTDRVLPDQTWTDIAHRLVQQPGVLTGDVPWIALRTGTHSVNLVARTIRPPSISALMTFSKEIEKRYDLAEARSSGAPLSRTSTATPEPATAPLLASRTGTRYGRSQRQ